MAEVTMQYFRTYVSNSIGGSGNQKFFQSDGDIHTGRVFYKVFCGGIYEYAFLFSNIIDSTYTDKTGSHNNLICDGWTIIQMRVAICIDVNNEIPESEFQDVTFGNDISKEVMPGEFFATDAVTLDASKNAYICVEITFRGSMIPHHHENVIPAFVKEGGAWRTSNYTPFVSMIGCTRIVKKKIAYLGDSITQGIGTEFNSYTHWNAVLSEMLGEEYAYWNLGIGRGTASDAASDGAWLYKAKQNDLVVVCFGVNDLLHNREEDQIKRDLKEIAEKLKTRHVQVVLQTIPPFDYEGEQIDKWIRINNYIKNELVAYVDMVFDVVPILCEIEENVQHVKYGTHPNSEGCRVWADALYPQMKKLLMKNL